MKPKKVTFQEAFAKDLARSRKTVAYWREYAKMADSELRIERRLTKRYRRACERAVASLSAAILADIKSCPADMEAELAQLRRKS